MAEKMPQTFANHTKLVPLFHYVALPILSINVILAIYRMAMGFSFETAWGAVVALALILLGFFARVFALGAQDRVIRLEERLRMHGLLPDDLKPSINDFTMNQLAALRFASDDDLPALARQVIDDSIGDRKTIKQSRKLAGRLSEALAQNAVAVNHFGPLGHRRSRFRVRPARFSDASRGVLLLFRVLSTTRVTVPCFVPGPRLLSVSRESSVSVFLEY